MTPEDIEEFCLSLPGAELRFPFESAPDVRAWCVHRKMFAWCTPKRLPMTVQLKADPELLQALLNNYAFIEPGYHMNKRHWISIRLDMPHDDDLVRGLLEDAHQLIVRKLPAKLRMGLMGD